MDMVVYQIRYKKFCSMKKKKKNQLLNVLVSPTETCKKNGNQTYIVSQNYTQFPGVVLGIDGAQPVRDKTKVKEFKAAK